MILKLFHCIGSICAVVILQTHSFSQTLAEAASSAKGRQLCVVCLGGQLQEDGRRGTVHGRPLLKKTWLVSGMPGNVRQASPPTFPRELRKWSLCMPETVVRGAGDSAYSEDFQETAILQITDPFDMRSLEPVELRVPLIHRTIFVNLELEIFLIGDRANQLNRFLN